MSLFCLLWIPSFYFLRRTGRELSAHSTEGAASSRRRSGFIWALSLGCAITAFQYFAGSLITPGGFGFSRWLNGFFDIVSFPVIIPLAVCFLLIKLNLLHVSADYAGFALMSLIPLAAYRSISWHFPGSPVLLVFVPLLWTAQAAGIPWLAGFIFKTPRWYVIAPSILGIVIMPLAASSSWWAFFSQRTLLGVLLLCAVLVPAVIPVALDFFREIRNQRITGSTNNANE